MPQAVEPAHDQREPVLSPVDRVCELCFGLFMALTFVGAVSVTTAGANAGRLMFYTALGCNVAWGLADAVMYLVRVRTHRGRRLAIALAVRGESEPRAGVLQLRTELTGAMRSLVSDAELEAVRARLAAMPSLPPHARVDASDFLAAAGIFALVVLGTFPVALPFVLLDMPHALLVSRILTLLMLFACGLALGRYAGGGGWVPGAAMTAVGILLTMAIIALGG